VLRVLPQAAKETALRKAVLSIVDGTPGCTPWTEAVRTFVRTHAATFAAAPGFAAAASDDADDEADSAHSRVQSQVGWATLHQQYVHSLEAAFEQVLTPSFHPTLTPHGTPPSIEQAAVEQARLTRLDST
jgi:hypothetical protein